MQPDGRPAALLQGAQVAERLRHLQPGEAERPAGDREIVRDHTGDLQERADLRAALVVLPGRVQEARRPAERHRPLGAPRERLADQRRGRIGVPVEVGHDGEVSALGNGAQQRGDDAREVVRAAEQDRVVGVHLDRAVGEHRVAFGQRAVAGLVEDLAGVVLRLLHVRLVERVDAEHPAGDRGGVLPHHELRAERAGDGGAVDVQVLARG